MSAASSNHPRHQRTSARRLRLVAFACLAVVTSHILVAQTTPPARRATTAEPTPAQKIATRLKQVDADTQLDADLKKQLTDRYTAAQAALQDAALADQKAAGFRDLLKRGLEQQKQVRSELDKLPKQVTINVDETIDSAELQRMIANQQARIDHPETGLQTRLKQADEQATSRVKRLQEIPAQLTDLEAALESNKKDQDATPPESEPQTLTEAKHVLLQSQRIRMERQKAALQAELAWLDPADTGDLLRDQRDLAQKQLTLAQEQIKRLQELLDRRRQSEAQEKVQSAQREAALAHPLLKPIADENQRLAEEDHKLAEQLKQVADNLTNTRERLDRLQSESTRTREMVDQVGLTEAIGLMLRKQRASIDSPRELRSRIQQRSAEIRDIRLKVFELEAQIAELADVEVALPKMLAKKNPDGPDVPEKTIEFEGEVLLKRQREILTGLSNNYSKYIEQLVSLDNAERKMMLAAEEYGSFIDERAFWIRTASWYSWTQFPAAIAAAAELLGADHWSDLAATLLRDIEQQPALWALVSFLLGLLLIFRSRIRRRLFEMGELAAEGSCRQFGPTLHAIALTLLIAAGPVGLIWFFGWRLDSRVGGSIWTQALGHGLLQAVKFGTPFILLQAVCMRRGLAEQHLAWDARSLRSISRKLRWFLPIALVMIVFFGLLEAHGDERAMDSLGRPLYMIMMVLLAIFCRAALESQPLPASFSQQNPWSARIRTWARTIGWLLPIALLLLVFAGYFYTATQLARRLTATAWLWVGLVLVHSIILRWITLQRRRLALQQAQQLRAQAESELKQTTENPVESFTLARFDLGAIVGQILRLLNTSLVGAGILGLWLIWADVVPALGILNRIELWQTAQQETVIQEGEEGVKTQTNVTRIRPVTAANLVGSLLVLAIGVVAGRNIPGLLEMSVLSRLPLDAGVRFAVILLCRYAIFIIGTVTAFGLIGVGWSNVQWLVAAASVGLGFGLQEIFANFVSGIILLMERPIRVGDVVTVGDVTGSVTQIRIRSTTILNGDRKELIVPNKELITGRLLNWTLSDTINRITINVRVAYDSDPRRVRELLMQLALEQPLVLRDPAPSATFEQLADSSLLFVLQCFLPNMDARQSTTDSLNTQILEKFRAEGIAIPFPQRDLNVRMWPAEMPPALAHKQNGEAVPETSPA